MLKPHRAAKYYYLKIIRLKGDPETLARGIAIGVFIGITPTLPLHTILIILFAYLLRGNTIAALVASALVSNPLTFLPQYYLAWKMGNLLLPGHLSWQKIREILAVIQSDIGFGETLSALRLLSYDAITVLLVGGIILALPPTLLVYPYSRKLFTAIHAKRRQKHVLD